MSATASYIELKIQKGIRQAEDDLVLWIENALDTCDYGKSGRSKLEEAQFRNLVRVADTTDSPEVIKNFVRYQVGRDDKWGRGKTSLAERIVEDINTQLKTKATAIALGSKTPQTSETVEESSDEKVFQLTKQEITDIQIELIRRYLGYGARHLKYLNSLRESK